jgi:hypothetical protein
MGFGQAHDGLSAYPFARWRVSANAGRCRPPNGGKSHCWLYLRPGHRVG